MKIYLSVKAEQNLIQLSYFLLNKWGLKAKNDFIIKLKKKFKQLSNQPYSCPKSSIKPNLYKCVVTKQTTMFYRINNDEIQIIMLFDTRQNPNKLAAK